MKFTRYTLYQTNRLTDYTGDFSEVAKELPFKPTAFIEAENLDDIYKMTQHGIMPTVEHNLDNFREDTSNWVGLLRQGIMPAVRSTSVGDVIVTGDKKVYVVAFAGFDHVGTVREIQEKYNVLQYER